VSQPGSIRQKEPSGPARNQLTRPRSGRHLLGPPEISLGDPMVPVLAAPVGASAESLHRRTLGRHEISPSLQSTPAIIQVHSTVVDTSDPSFGRSTHVMAGRYFG
jgi:hypothetical protein